MCSPLLPDIFHNFSTYLRNNFRNVPLHQGFRQIVSEHQQPVLRTAVLTIPAKRNVNQLELEQ